MTFRQERFNQLLALEQGWELYYGDWREYEVKEENGK